MTYKKLSQFPLIATPLLAYAAGEDFPDYSDWIAPTNGISLDPLETLQAVVWVVKNADNCADAFSLACSLGGDTDTVAALAGALFAARWPEKADFYSR